MGVPQQVIDEVRDKTDMLGMIEQYVHLKKAGKNYVGLCPFHPDQKTPSLSVKPDSGMFYCFGCGAGGNAYTFLMRIENLTFIEAVENLARRCGVEIPKTQHDRKASAEEKQKYEGYLWAYQEAAAFYQVNLTKNKGVMDHLTEKRGLNVKTIEEWGLGYAPELWDALKLRLLKQFSEKELVEFGLVKMHEKTGRVYDFFRDRIMFPIENLKGEIIAFGGRRFSEDENAAKFLNTPETHYYHKSRELYGLGRARKSIGQKKYAINVEGYFDTIALWQAGFENTVSPCGTAFSYEHLDLLRKATEKIIFLPDPDAPGKKEVIKAAKKCLEKGFRARIADLSELTDKDPDEAINEHGAEEVEKIIQKHKSAVMFAAGNIKIDADDKFRGIEEAVYDELYPIIDSASTIFSKRVCLAEVSRWIRETYPDCVQLLDPLSIRRDYVEYLQKKMHGREQTDLEVMVLSHLARDPSYRGTAPELLRLKYRDGKAIENFFLENKTRRNFFRFITELGENVHDRVFLKPNLAIEPETPLFNHQKQIDMIESFKEYCAKKSEAIVGISGIFNLLYYPLILAHKEEIATLKDEFAVDKEEIAALFFQMGLVNPKSPKCIGKLKSIKLNNEIMKMRAEVSEAQKKRDSKRTLELTKLIEKAEEELNKGV